MGTQFSDQIMKPELDEAQLESGLMVPATPFELHAGPVEIDTSRLGQETAGLGVVLLFLLLLRLGVKLIGRL